ncbi:hypothetical protein [Hungatella hathewayi]|uniref:hypothetical protein n=1 Tax=Hungatella hathewayi TaxID=154046 RepID=UPI003561E367
MSTSYERTFRAEVLKECLAGVAGKLFRLNTKKGKELSFEAGVLANKLLDPHYDSDESLDEAEKKYESYKRIYEVLKKGV